MVRVLCAESTENDLTEISCSIAISILNESQVGLIRNINTAITEFKSQRYVEVISKNIELSIGDVIRMVFKLKLKD